MHQGKEATALQRRGERTRLGDEQRVTGALNATKASLCVQREMDSDESAENATRESYERARPDTEMPGAAQPEPDVVRQARRHREVQYSAEREVEK
jgi:hypothetical protein